MLINVICMTSFSPLSRHHAKTSWFSGREQKSRSLKLRRCGNQRFQVLICLGDGMGKETQVGRISGDASQVLDDSCGVRADRFVQLCATVEPMHSAA